MNEKGEHQAFQFGKYGVAVHLTIVIPNSRIHFHRYHICIPLEVSPVHELYTSQMDSVALRKYYI